MTTVTEIKNVEILVNNKFEWNFAFRTPYDYLETFLAIGVLMETDTIAGLSQKVSPLSDVRGSEQPPSYSLHSKSMLDRAGMSPKERGERISYENAKHHTTPSTTLGIIMVGNLVQEMQTELRRKVRDTCLEVAEYLSATCICHPAHHKSLAFAIVMFARKHQLIQDYE
jgi:hypothetical protein